MSVFYADDYFQFIDECNEYYENAPKYISGLVFVQSGFSGNDEQNYYKWLYRLCKKYKGLSVLFIISTHKSNSKLWKKKIITHKVGRPKKIVIGDETTAHCHGLIINENTDTNIVRIKDDLTKYINKTRKKRPELKQQKSSFVNGMFIVKYMDRQADTVHKIGDFDFDYFTDEHYYKVKNEDNFSDILNFEN